MNNEEGRQLTEEDLKNMSPEELLELERKNCLFCNILSDKIPSRKIYEDDKALAVLDINPAAPGHMLLMTKEHYQIMPQIPDDTVMHLGETAKMLSQTALRGMHVRGTTIFIANGAVAGQRAPHFIVHIIPRDDGDGVGIEIPEGEVSEKDNQAAGKELQKKLAELMQRAAPGDVETMEDAGKGSEESLIDEGKGAEKEKAPAIRGQTQKQVTAKPKKSKVKAKGKQVVTGKQKITKPDEGKGKGGAKGKAKDGANGKEKEGHESTLEDMF